MGADAGWKLLMVEVESLEVFFPFAVAVDMVPEVTTLHPGSLSGEGIEQRSC